MLKLELKTPFPMPMLDRRFFVSKSGRHYFLDGAVLYTYDRGEGKWNKSSRSLQEVIAEGRLNEVDSADDFVFYARNAYYALEV